MIDGGKGQLGAALEAMAGYDLPRVAVIALAKREEEVFCPAGRLRCCSNAARPGLQLLQRIRDEAHRFALGFHRQRRARAAVDSIFDDLPGVGPARRKLLMEHFGTGRGADRGRPRAARGVPGLPPKVGRQIHAALHKTG